MQKSITCLFLNLIVGSDDELLSCKAASKTRNLNYTELETFNVSFKLRLFCLNKHLKDQPKRKSFACIFLLNNNKKGIPFHLKTFFS